MSLNWLIRLHSNRPLPPLIGNIRLMRAIEVACHQFYMITCKSLFLLVRGSLSLVTSLRDVLYGSSSFLEVAGNVIREIVSDLMIYEERYCSSNISAFVSLFRNISVLCSEHKTLSSDLLVTEIQSQGLASNNGTKVAWALIWSSLAPFIKMVNMGRKTTG